MKTPSDRITEIERNTNTLMVKALSLKLALSKAEFHEEDHPRADDGKFGSGSGNSGTNKKPQGESAEERHARHKKEEEDENRSRKEAEERHQKGVDAKHFPPPTKEDVDEERQSAKDIVGEVSEYGKKTAMSQYEGILRDIERGKNGDGTSDYSWMPARMVALKEEYEKQLKL